MKKPFAMRDGDRLFVVRPQDPYLAIQLTRALIAAKLPTAEAELQFSKIMHSQPYTFVGFYAKDLKSILDDKGWKVGSMKPGDTFVGFDLVNEEPTVRGSRMEFIEANYDPTDPLAGANKP